MPIITLSDTLANTTVSNIAVALNYGSTTSGAICEIYSGVKPAKPDEAISMQVLLGTTTCQPICGVVSGRSLIFNAITQDDVADATRTATWARFKDRDGTPVIDVDAGVTGSSAFLQMNTTNIVQGGPISITSCVISA